MVVGVVGAGTLGRTAALAALAAGSPVTVLVRARPNGCAVVADDLSAVIRHDVERGRLDPARASETLSRLRVTDDVTELEDVDAVVESVPEDVPAKRAVLAAVEDVVAADTLIASTTSTIPAAVLADGARHPERVVVAHFVWPAHRMPLVEVAMHARTSPQAAATLDRLLTDLGKTPVRVADRPGFLITRALFAYWNAALELLAAGHAPAQVDAAHLAWGWPMGPAEVMQRTGLASATRIHAWVAPALGHPFPMLSVLEDAVARSLAAGVAPEHLAFDEATLDLLRSAAAPRLDPAGMLRHTVGALAAETDLAVREGVVGAWPVAGAAVDLAYGFPAEHGGLHQWWSMHGEHAAAHGDAAAPNVQPVPQPA